MQREATAFGKLARHVGAERACAVLRALRTENEYRSLLAQCNLDEVTEPMNLLLRSFGYRDRFELPTLPQVRAAARRPGTCRTEIETNDTMPKAASAVSPAPFDLPVNALDHSLRVVTANLNQTAFATLLRVDRRLIGDWTRGKKIRASKFGHGWDYSREDILRFLEDGANGLALLPLDDPRTGLSVPDFSESADVGPFFTVEGAAHRLAYTRDHVNVLARENLLAATRVGRSWIIPAVGIAIFRAQRANAAR